MPHYDLSGRMTSTGGRYLKFHGSVVRSEQAKVDHHSDFIEVDYSDGSMLYRTEMGESFDWDPRMFVFEDLDRSLQIIRSGKWKQAISPLGRLIHDRSWNDLHNYDRDRLAAILWRRAYRSFRLKWGLRFDLRSHVLFEVVYPMLASLRTYDLISRMDRFGRERDIGRRPTN